MKICSRCKVEQPLDNFYTHASSKDGVAYVCKSCVKTKQKERYQEDPQKFRDRNKKYVRDNLHIQASWYDITKDDLIFLLEKQQSRCAVCKSEFDLEAPRAFHIDHDHRCDHP